MNQAKKNTFLELPWAREKKWVIISLCDGKPKARTNNFTMNKMESRDSKF